VKIDPMTWVLILFSLIGVIVQVMEFVQMANRFEDMKNKYEQKMKISLAEMGF
jgi:hypothetical protein